MRTSVLFLLGLLLVTVGMRPAAAAPPDPSGYWVTGPDEAVVQVYACGPDTLCGALVGFPMDHPDEAMPMTWDHRPQCRFVFITDLHPRTRAWLGKIINPQNGHTYGAKIRLMSEEQLRLRGYFLLPMLGSTRFWTRYKGPPPPPDCRLPAHSLG